MIFTNCIEASVATTIATDDAWIAAAITANNCATIRLMMSSTRNEIVVVVGGQNCIMFTRLCVYIVSAMRWL